MRIQILKKATFRIQIITVSVMMVTSLLYPLSARADSLEQQPIAPETTQTAQAPEPEASLSTPISPTPPAADDLGSNAQQTQTSTNVDANTSPVHTSAESTSTLSNSVDSHAQSGNANGSTNTTVGDITSGDATALTTIVNLLQSNVNLNGNQPLVFVTDVNGNVLGDILIDPAALAQSLNSTSPLYGDNNSSSSHSSTQAIINNAINTSAASGSATAHQNTTAGDIQSGSAYAVTNIMNIVNSAITANQSFIGMVNIYGSLDGDILLPASFVTDVLGTSTPIGNISLPITTIDNNATVVNTVNANAQSGNATATENSNSGSLSTGQATTNVTIYDLTSSQSSGKNALLVFVNVLGSWVGLILDAPAGTTSASLGGGTPTANNSISDLSSTTNLSINNNINTQAQSGNAVGHENTNVGSIASGNAGASVNILNILNSQISLSDWFGVLFINVFGSWNGNFGTQTAIPTNSNQPPQNPNNPMPATFSFVSFTASNNSKQTSYTRKASSTNRSNPACNQNPTSNSAVLSNTSSNKDDNVPKKISLSTKNDSIQNQNSKLWIIVLIGILAAIALVAERFLAAYRRRRAEEDHTAI